MRELERHEVIRQRLGEAQQSSAPDLSFEGYMADLEVDQS
jgi:hypothetical protein